MERKHNFSSVQVYFFQKVKEKKQEGKRLQDITNGVKKKKLKTIEEDTHKVTFAAVCAPRLYYQKNMLYSYMYCLTVLFTQLEITHHYNLNYNTDMWRLC